jgi:hypothetical protein
VAPYAEEPLAQSGQCGAWCGVPELLPGHHRDGAVRDRFNAVVERHEVARELTMRLLAVVFVVVGPTGSGWIMTGQATPRQYCRI